MDSISNDQLPADNPMIKALQESQERLLRVITDAPIILWAMDMDGIITLSEGKGLSRVGLKPGEVVGQSVFERNAEYPEAVDVFKRALKGEEITSTQEIRGEFYEVHYSPQRDAAGVQIGVIAVSEIISERKRAEEALRESEERYRSLVENSMDGVLLTNPEDGGILSANAAACRIFNMSEKELCSLGRAGVVDSSDPRAIAFLIERQKTGKAQGEFTLIRKGGAKFPAEVTSSVFTDRNGNLRSSMIVRDITSRKLAEAAMRASEERYQSIFNVTRDGIFITDQDGNLLDYNPEAHRMLGYTWEEFRWLKSRQLVHPDSLSTIVDYLNLIKEGKQFQGRATGLRKDGSTFPVEVFGTPITYNGQPHMLAVVRDITEQVQAYHLLEQRVSERTRELSALLDVSRNVASTLELKPLLALILNQLQTVVDYTGAAIVTLEDDSFTIQDYIGSLPRDRALQIHIPLKAPTVFREVATQLAPIIFTDLWGAYPANQEVHETLTGILGELFQNTHSWIGVPLVVRDCLMGVLSVDHIQPGFYTQQDARLVWAFADQAAVAIGNAGLYTQAQELAALEERQKLARELHDSVSQALYGIALGARTARTLIDRDPPKAIEPIDYCLSLAEAGLAEMRALIFELRPESLEKEGLVVALTKQADALRARLEIQVETHFCEEPDISLEIKQVYYRIAQEALQNIYKHAQATQVVIELNKTDRMLTMSIQDNGCGFDDQAKFPGHMGLMSMRERIQKIGGKLIIRSAPGQGTRIDVELEERFGLKESA